MAIELFDVRERRGVPDARVAEDGNAAASRTGGALNHVEQLLEPVLKQPVCEPALETGPVALVFSVERSAVSSVRRRQQVSQRHSTLAEKEELAVAFDELGLTYEY